MSIIAYCDDLILLSPIKAHIKLLLQKCDQFAVNWKIRFNSSKSTIYCTDPGLLGESDLSIGGGPLRKVVNFDYLGLPIGTTEYTENYFETKFRTVEKSFYSIRRVGIHKGFWFPNTLGFIYKQYCQSIFNYGLELIHINKGQIKRLESRQASLFKVTLGISKYCRNKPLLEALRVSTLEELYFKHKFLFLKQLNNNLLAKNIFEYLKCNQQKKNKSSYITQLKDLSKVINIEAIENDKKITLELLKKRFSCGNLGLVDSVRTAMSNPLGGRLVGLLLRVEFGNPSGMLNTDDVAAVVVGPDGVRGGGVLGFLDGGG